MMGGRGRRSPSDTTFGASQYSNYRSNHPKYAIRMYRSPCREAGFTVGFGTFSPLETP